MIGGERFPCCTNIDPCEGPPWEHVLEGCIGTYWGCGVHAAASHCCCFAAVPIVVVQHTVDLAA
eukprot:7423832-Prorocentrum_lima.AAC.1